MTIQQILYSVVVFIVSLLIHALSLFIASSLFKSPKRPTFGKALRVLINIYLVIFILWIVGQFVIYLLLQIGVGVATSTLIYIVDVVVIILSILYYFKEIKNNYGLSFISAVLLIILMWIVNIALIYLADLFLSPMFDFGIPLYDVFFGYHITF